MKRLFALVFASALMWYPAALHAQSGTNRKVTIVNRTKAVIMEIYASGIDSDAWNGKNLINAAIFRGESRDVDFADDTDTCRMDILIVFGNDWVHTSPEGGIDVCTDDMYVVDHVDNP